MTLKDNTTAGFIYHLTLLRLLFPVRMKKIVAHDFRYDPRRRGMDRVCLGGFVKISFMSTNSYVYK